MDIDITITENYRDDDYLRQEYYNFISKVFPGISFNKWYQKGFWTKDYIPFSIVKSGKIISNVSVCFMNILLGGKRLNAIQIGAVGTLPEYRNQGFSRLITNYVLDKYKNQIDLFFLFANDNVMEFYPKFGFRNLEENICVLESNIPKPKYSARKLNIKVESDYILLLDLINNRKPITNIFGAVDYGFITMWHILNLYLNDLYYLKNENIIVIKTEKNNTVHIWDVIYCKPFDFQLVLPKIIDSNSVKSIQYHFPPDQLEYRYNNIINEKSGLFVLGEIKIEDELLKFPETAHT